MVHGKKGEEHWSIEFLVAVILCILLGVLLLYFIWKKLGGFS